MATTPPPPSPSKLRVPPAPRHGPKYDSWEPYGTRHSARIASQRASRDTHTTPPPSSPELRGQAGRMEEHKQRDMDVGTLSPPGSTFTSPRKKTSGRGKGVIPAYSLDNTELSSSDLFGSAQTTRVRQPSFEASRTTMTNGMLPTPMKTPRKKAVEDVSSAARTLFPTASTSARPKKSKKYSGFSLESFEEESTETHGKIEIFTDSRDRIPQLDESEENPFYKKPAAPAITETAAPRTSSRRKANGSKRDKEVDNAIDRKDGMTYVFRGRKIFRKFDEDVDMDSGDEDDDDDLGLLAARPDLIDESLTSVRPLTRSSIKPRVLFPAAQKTGPDAVEEEEATDVEDSHIANEPEVDAGNEETDAQKEAVTPAIRSSVTTPASPGATIRSLRSRSKHIAQDATPSAPQSKNEKRISPFNGWMRKKQPTPTGLAAASKKREADPVAGIGGPATKKTKGK
ncbi:hypothetical protein C8Q69DRAFT_19913 [Paecilomyces variotii]|uniref:Uncharacterized protein n=1 Tax=Byssochlamys spectabilis TaxID=264951 RepID=A0A443I5F4_BYSSP|nr:hypothetical protein C8Q69DRAFT_19913 [Paecilomyces variotii]KAJ9352721.1 hypothetical protein DTO280E4_7614 [Paecilomyces variotii]RWQ99294.1 hypothetical protein C8Q69DRAFT_19913 [Paecilomyces variotii]